jgi:NTP pyrophosphatase (non-canonical NTP hydrolase)
MDKAQAFAMVAIELEKAEHKHGFDRTPMNPKMPMVDRLAILMEEVGEVAHTITYDGNGDRRAELTQVAAMAIAWMIGEY